MDCGDEVCRVFASTMVNGMSVELLANSDGGVGRLRAGGPASGTVTETGLTSKGVRLNHNSLRCATGATPVCLVRGPYDGGMAGEVHVWRGDSWATVDRFFFSDGGVVMLDCAKSGVTIDAELRRRVDDLLGPDNFRLVGAAPRPSSANGANNRRRAMARN